MNPSAKGWIKKLLSDRKKLPISAISYTLDEFYDDLKDCGFIYGTNVRSLFEQVPTADYTHDELCKINLVLSFAFMHEYHQHREDFAESMYNFYILAGDHKNSFFQGLFLGKKTSYELLETIINKRIAIDDNVITKNFNYFITNTLLFVDVLAYENYLQSGAVPNAYLQTLEAAIETCVFTALDVKTEKSSYDRSLIKLFEASFRYVKRERLQYAEVLTDIQHPLVKKYSIDLVCMTFWSDKIIDPKERDFLTQLAIDLQVSDTYVSQAIDDIYAYYATYKNDIKLLKSHNMVQTFYNNSALMVSKLLVRNKKRLLKELQESKELMYLLSQSTKRSLTEAEQKKVKVQLLDIFKSIPSLAIFMLPGGMLLLPFVIKIIPNILPSSFDENRIED